MCCCKNRTGQRLPIQRRFTTVRVDLPSLAKSLCPDLIGKLAPGIMTSFATTEAWPSALTMRLRPGPCSKSRMPDLARDYYVGVSGASRLTYRDGAAA